MAITYKELRSLIRFKLKDNNKIRFSDYDLKMSVNEVLRYFSNSYALQNTDFFERSKFYDEFEMNKEVKAQNEEIDKENAEIDSINKDREANGEDLLPHIPYIDLYNFHKTGVELPDDFVTIQGIIRGHNSFELHPSEGVRPVKPLEYKITGDRLYVSTPHFTLLYKAALPEIDGKDDDEIDVPFTFKDALVKLTCMVLENNPSTDVLMETVEEVAAKLVPRRRYVQARIKMPFKV